MLNVPPASPAASDFSGHGDPVLIRVFVKSTIDAEDAGHELRYETS